MTTDIEYRVERPCDRAAVLRVHARAFGDHGRKVGELLEALSESPAELPELSIVAARGREVIGHAAVTKSLLDAPERLVDVAVLSPLGVLPEEQGRGVGSELVRRAVAATAEAGWPLLFLEGDPGYYSRLGFEAAGGHGFRRPSLRIPEPAFQVVRLAAHEPWMTGTLVYAEPFWHHDCVGLRDTI
ncbi:N-acetyltransferase [Phytomonospora sp. NPDC050363]|uniref:GNAT family N-acetyltransferase n=1 Tax=Phytomonospora sp. NPDC050363 TaxID=3155642 RepID=UPI0033F1DB49